jgi:cyclohexa-1,5-dienecarbonyl-CoA hydratase
VHSVTHRTIPKTAATPVRLEVLESGSVWRLVLDTPKANVLDAHKIEALTKAFLDVREARAVKAVILEGAGAHFSFGASVEEHLPGRCAVMIGAFHALFRAMLTARVPMVSAVRGQCLGGALELASFGTHVIVAPDATLGQPEIRLGVIAPVASWFLHERIGRTRAENLCVTGRSVQAPEAFAMGLADQIAEDPSQAALEWVCANLAPHSASSLRFAVAAARASLAERFEREMTHIERLYLDELMHTDDAREGLRAFLEKRPPVWRNS